MSQYITSRARRRVLIASAGALGLPLAGRATGSPQIAPQTALTPLAFAARGSEELVLSGRVTDTNSAAVSGAAIALSGTGLTTVSDADGRFLLVAAAPAAAYVELQISTRSGQTLRRLVHAASDADAPQFSAAQKASLAGAQQRVWRASVGLSITA